ncbi:hypothetical protein RCL1_008803 [Eukaryota sp. TZLM3-RCL]
MLTSNIACLCGRRISKVTILESRILESRTLLIPVGSICMDYCCPKLSAPSLTTYSEQVLAETRNLVPILKEIAPSHFYPSVFDSIDSSVRNGDYDLTELQEKSIVGTFRCAKHMWKQYVLDNQTSINWFLFRRDVNGVSKVFLSCVLLCSSNIEAVSSHIVCYLC